MHRLLLLIVLLISTKSLSQDQEIFTIKTVEKLAVIEGCESKESNKKELYNCNSTKINQMLSDELIKTFDRLVEIGVKSESAQLKFVITKEGQIDDVKLDSATNQYWGSSCVSAMKRVGKRIKNGKTKITPAQLSDGTPVNLYFTIPIRFQSI